jgi:hypothetical protein
MLRNHAAFSFGNAGRFVNGLVAILMVTLIGASYFAALGRIIVA